MGKESFENLYPIIDAIAHNKGGSLIKAVENLVGVKADILKEQAEKILNFMEGYTEPVLPFKDVTREQIQKSYDTLKKQYGFVIWSNRLADTDEACADIVQNNPDEYLGYSEDDMRLIANEFNNEEKESLKAEFDQISINGLIVTGTIARWDGQKPAFGIRDSLNNIFDTFTGNEYTLYIQDGQLKGENIHHDGTDHYTFYTCKEGMDPESICYIERIDTRADIESLVPILSKHFGWKMD